MSMAKMYDLVKSLEAENNRLRKEIRMIEEHTDYLADEVQRLKKIIERIRYEVNSDN